MSPSPGSFALQHAFHQITQRTPEIFATGQVMLVNKEHILLKAGIEVRLQAQFANHGVVVAVYMGVDAVHALINLTR